VRFGVFFQKSPKAARRQSVNEVQKKKHSNRNRAYFHAEKNGMCTGKKKCKEVNIHKIYTELQNTRIHRILFWIKCNAAKVHNCVSFSRRKCFFSFQLKVNVVEDLIWFDIEDHTFGPTKTYLVFTST